MLQGLYWETYGRIIDAVNKHDISKGHDREVSAFLIYITFSIIDEDAAKYIPVHPDEFYHHRLRFYLGLKRSDLLNNWNCPSIAKLDDNPLFISFIAFGDLLINSYARSDYRTAPLQVRGFTETMEFSMTMLLQILPCINSYVERLFECRKRGRIGSGKSRKHALSNKSNHSRKKRKKNDSNDIGSLKFWVLLVIGLAAIVVLGYFIMQDIDIKLPETRSDGVAIVSSTSTPRPTATPRRTATPRPTSTPLPVSTYNGKLIITPDYSQVCPLEVIAGTDTDYYIYLDYQYSPHLTQESRSRKATATSPYEGDIAFIVKAGQRVSIDVPIGVYKFYYATGTTFFGSKYLFGDDTQCYKADNLLSFYYADQYYQGHTITLYKTVGGNFDTDSIPDKSFPTK